METELIQIVNEQRQPIGVAARAEIHRLGYWHETFQCWVATSSNLSGREPQLYLQLRSTQKKDYPGLLDITAAGHLLVDETVADGVREIEEEIGLHVQLEQLIFLDILQLKVDLGEMLDREFAHVYLLDRCLQWDEFVLQKEEVVGILCVSFRAFKALWLGEADLIEGEGFIESVDGARQFVTEHRMTRDQFVPHGQAYYEEIIRLIESALT